MIGCLTLFITVIENWPEFLHDLNDPTRLVLIIQTKQGFECACLV
jgi:hypothetical protein